MPSPGAGLVWHYGRYRRPHHVYSRRDGRSCGTGRRDDGGDRNALLRRSRAGAGAQPERAMDQRQAGRETDRQRKPALPCEGSARRGPRSFHRSFSGRLALAKATARPHSRAFCRRRRYRTHGRTRTRHSIYLHRPQSRHGQARNHGSLGRQSRQADCRGRRGHRGRERGDRVIAGRVRTADRLLPLGPDRPYSSGDTRHPSARGEGRQRHHGPRSDRAVSTGC